MSKTGLGSLMLTRRSFIKSTAVMGAAAGLIGCTKKEAASTAAPETAAKAPTPLSRFYGVTGHNCGGRCLSVAEANNGRIVRILTDESTHSYDGTPIDPENRNQPNTRSCTKCRAYKYRIYHPGRLTKPLKQTKKRGDLSGFVEISWEQAISEIAAKHKNVIEKYGIDAVYNIYAAGASAGVFNTASGALNSFGGPLIGGGVTSYWASYSTHQWWFVQSGLTGADAARGNHSNNLAKYANSVVMWGDNGYSTSNPTSYSTMRAIEDMKARVSKKEGYDENFDGRVVYIGPEFSDTGVVSADEWLPSKPYTDAALVAGVIYHMLDNTFDLSTGALKANPWLDVDYLDTLVYGFFDSPAYNLEEATGTISAAKASTKDGVDRNVPATEAGQSYVSWVLGNNGSAPTYATLGKDSNYTAARFAEIAPALKRWAPCSYEVKGAKASAQNAKASLYKTKQDYLTPKTPAWASAITGVSEERIKYLAELFCKHGPVFVRWSGGFQKQAEGVTNFFAAQMLHVITKNVGDEGSIFTWGPFSSATTKGTVNPLGGYSTLNTGKLPVKPVASCTAWHAVIKNTYHEDLAKSGYKAQYIPNYGDIKKDNAYWDDGGVKAFVQWRRNPDGSMMTYTDDKGREFFDWEGRTGQSGTADAHAGTPVYAGIRLMYNGGGNIFMNQHENTNDSREMLEALPLNNANDADSFCCVSIDNFLSATPRWSDYVLPGATYWEQSEIMGPNNSNTFYMQPVSQAPGEAKQTFDIVRDIIRQYIKIGGKTLFDNDPFGAVKDATAAGDPKLTADAYINSDVTPEEIVRIGFEKTKSKYPETASMSWEDYKANPVFIRKADDDTVVVPFRKAMMTSYKNFSKEDLKTKPFILVAEEYADKGSPFLSTNNTRHVVTYEIDTMCRSAGAGGAYGVQYYDISTAPKASLKMQVSNPVMVWNYIHRFEKWHGYLKDVNKMGQKKRDLEGDPLVMPIPMYYAWQDYFVEAYADKDAEKKYPFMLTTTHNRHRAHSSMAETSLLRELCHSVPGQTDQGLVKKGNDHGFYALPMAGGVFPPLASLVNGGRDTNVSEANLVDAANKDKATFNQILMNATDGAKLGLKTGDLVEVRNPVGIVYCVAKLTKRCAKGFVSVHQGTWYDPRMINGEIVDVGGCCNTLMASQPSRIDHGNAEQSALVAIRKINY